MYAEYGSVAALARHLGISRNGLKYHLLKAGIRIRRSGYTSPKSISHSGEEAPNWQGGITRHSAGYIYEFAPSHPSVAHRLRKHRYVLQHRLVLEAKLGRYLEPYEDAHHINEVKDDNRPENIELMDRREHRSHHKENCARDLCGRFAVG